ncbi:unnamed protein product [Acanthosepion pharaonis]|uniref:Uncharacterized protein n=1 Tax=Acanthosepion pharaonis TaxID=158019 RepID=A0A812BL35_ACAPH|nr:unnamed protein product [Sepia pharaonis]
MIGPCLHGHDGSLLYLSTFLSLSLPLFLSFYRPPPLLLTFISVSPLPLIPELLALLSLSLFLFQPLYFTLPPPSTALVLLFLLHLSNNLGGYQCLANCIYKRSRILSIYHKDPPACSYVFRNLLSFNLFLKISISLSKTPDLFTSAVTSLYQTLAHSPNISTFSPPPYPRFSPPPYPRFSPASSVLNDQLIFCLLICLSLFPKSQKGSEPRGRLVRKESVRATIPTHHPRQSGGAWEACADFGLLRRTTVFVENDGDERRAKERTNGTLHARTKHGAEAIILGLRCRLAPSAESFSYTTTVPQIALVLIAHPSPTTASSLLPLIVAIPFPNPATVFLVPRGGFLQAENIDGRFRHVRFYIILFLFIQVSTSVINFQSSYFFFTFRVGVGQELHLEPGEGRSFLDIRTDTRIEHAYTCEERTNTRPLSFHLSLSLSPSLPLSISLSFHLSLSHGLTSISN